MNKREIFKDYITYSAGNYISQALGMISGFLLRAFLEPYAMGIWQGLSVIKSYTSYTNLGVSKSAAREIAYFRGKGDDSRSEVLKNTGFTFSIIMVSLAGIGCISFALFKRSTLDEYAFWGLIVMGGVVILERIESYIVTILRSKKKFFPESLGKTINAILNIVLVVLIVRNYKLFGLYATTLIIMTFSILILILLSKERFLLAIERNELKHLIKIGIPLVFLGFMYVNLMNIDRIVIIKLLGAEMLGLYSVAIMMGNLVYNISTMASVVLYPRFQEKYAKRDDKRDVYIMMRKIIKFLWFPLIVVLIGGIIFFPYLIKMFIPKYVEGITSMRILLCGIYFFSLAIFCSHYLITIGKQVLSLFICIGAVIINLILSILFIKLGFSIEGVALATSISYFLYFILLFIMAHRVSAQVI